MTDVTIVIPTRERVDYLRIALHSVLASAAQAAVDGVTTRVLVVDDASPTDATQRLCAELGVDYERIPVHSGRNNPAAAIVLGVAQVASTWYSLFGDDDVMLPRFIRAHVERLRAGADVCTSSFLRTDANLVTTREVTLPAPVLGDLLANAMTINDGAMTRTGLVRDVRWDADLAQQLLLPVWLELLYRGTTFARLTEPTFLYRRHDDNVSDLVDDAELALRQPIVDEYRARVLARDGVIPEPTPKASSRAAGPSTAAWRRAAGRAKRSLTGRLER